jgi:D-amino-acid oxidase
MMYHPPGSEIKLTRQFREIPPGELPEGVKSGMGLTTVAINPQIYLPYLYSQLLSLGCTFVRRHLSHIRDAMSLVAPPPKAIINASGLLACKLGGVVDKDVYPTRGQTILVRNQCSQMYFRSAQRLGEEPTYVIPRPYGGGTILGGCRQHGNWYKHCRKFGDSWIGTVRSIRTSHTGLPSNASNSHPN